MMPYRYEPFVSALLERTLFHTVQFSIVPYTVKVFSTSAKWLLALVLKYVGTCR